MELKGVDVAVRGHGTREGMRQRRTACAALQYCAVSHTCALLLAACIELHADLSEPYSAVYAFVTF